MNQHDEDVEKLPTISKGNPSQHVAHFIEACNNVGTYRDLMVNQFICSVKGNMFKWYINLTSASINSEDQLEHEFLNCFHSTRSIFSMIELTNTC